MFYETENLPAEYEHIPTPEEKKKFRKNVRILIGHREQMGKKAMGQIFIVKQGGMEG